MEVSRLNTPARQSINVTVESAPMLLELCEKAAVTGAQAHLLADLYAQAKAAVEKLCGPPGGT